MLVLSQDHDGHSEKDTMKTKTMTNTNTSTVTNRLLYNSDQSTVYCE